MVRIKHLFAVLALITVLLPSLLLVFLPDPVKAATSISINLVSGNVDTSVLINGEGFVGRLTAIRWDKQVIAQQVPISEAAKVTYNFNIPFALKGNHFIQITDDSNWASSSGNHFIGAFGSKTAISEPVSGPVGTEVTVSGAGFRIGEDGITITYDGEIIKCNIVAESDGSWTTTVEIPPSTKGRHRIGIYGSSFTPIGVVRDSYFDVIPQIQINLVPQMYFGPTSKKMSTKFTVTGTGFAKDESVNISFDAIELAAAVADGSGSFSAILGVPQVKTSKEYVIAVAGSSGSSAQANFFIEKSQPLAPQLLSPVQGARLEIFGSLVDVILEPTRYLTGVFDYLRGPTPKSLKPGLVTFVWTKTAESSNATYVLQIARTYDFSSPVLVKEGLGSSSYTLSRDDVLTPGVYNWRVKTVEDSGDEGEWSESSKFEVISSSDRVLTITICVVSLLLLIVALVVGLLIKWTSSVKEQ